MKKKSKSKSRYTSPREIIKVNTAHFFECAWCGTKMTERHHIYEFSKGGSNISENLILLCPNCHTEVHSKSGNIKTEDLLQRKSTHLKGDRFGGNLQFTLEKNRIKLGTTFFEDCETIITYGNEERIMFLEYFGDGYYLSTRFYNKDGDLVFWMSKNRYWAHSSFQINISSKSIKIENNLKNSYKLDIWQNENENHINLKGIFYRKGSAVIIGDERLIIGNESLNQITIAGGGTITGKTIINL